MDGSGPRFPPPLGLACCWAARRSGSTAPHHPLRPPSRRGQLRRSGPPISGAKTAGQHRRPHAAACQRRRLLAGVHTHAQLGAVVPPSRFERASLQAPARQRSVASAGAAAAGRVQQLPIASRLIVCPHRQRLIVSQGAQVGCARRQGHKLPRPLASRTPSALCWGLVRVQADLGCRGGWCRAGRREDGCRECLAGGRQQARLMSAPAPLLSTQCPSRAQATVSRAHRAPARPSRPAATRARAQQRLRRPPVAAAACTRRQQRAGSLA